MNDFIVRWHCPHFLTQRGERRFAREPDAVWETHAYRERRCQATCYETDDDGSEIILPIITWTDRIEMAVHRLGVHRADNTPVSPYQVVIIEGFSGAVDVRCYWREPLGLYKPDWTVKRMVTGELTTEGVMTPAAEAVARLVAHGDWQPMSWRAWEGSEVQRRDEAVGDQFAAAPFAQLSMPISAAGST